MFLFFGIGPRTKRYGYVHLQCDVHGSPAQQELSSYRSWFKLFFFLPVFPVGRERHLLTCSQCGAQFEVSAQEARQLASQAGNFDQPYPGDPSGGNYTTTPQRPPGQPIRARSRRLDRGA